MKKYKGIILIVDDVEVNIRSIKFKLENEDYFFYSYTNGRSAIYAIKNQGINYDLALIDFSLSDMNGRRVIDCSKKYNPKTPVFTISSYNVDFSKFSKSDGKIPKDKDLVIQIEEIFREYYPEKK